MEHNVKPIVVIGDYEDMLFLCEEAEELGYKIAENSIELEDDNYGLTVFYPDNLIYHHYQKIIHLPINHIHLDKFKTPSDREFIIDILKKSNTKHHMKKEYMEVINRARSIVNVLKVIDHTNNTLEILEKKKDNIENDSDNSNNYILKIYDINNEYISSSFDKDTAINILNSMISAHSKVLINNISKIKKELK